MGTSADVAHALVRAASALMPTQGEVKRKTCRDESRHGTHECVRHGSRQLGLAGAHSHRSLADMGVAKEFEKDDHFVFEVGAGTARISTRNLEFGDPRSQFGPRATGLRASIEDRGSQELGDEPHFVGGKSRQEAAGTETTRWISAGCQGRNQRASQGGSPLGDRT